MHSLLPSYTNSSFVAPFVSMHVRESKNHVWKNIAKEGRISRKACVGLSRNLVTCQFVHISCQCSLSFTMVPNVECTPMQLSLNKLSHKFDIFNKHKPNIFGTLRYPTCFAQALRAQKNATARCDHRRVNSKWSNFSIHVYTRITYQIYLYCIIYICILCNM